MSEILTLKGKRICFSKPLREATIVARPNRFIVDVLLDGVPTRCHCPSTGSIGDLRLDGLPCLVSGPHSGSKRSTAYTMEAFSLSSPPVADRQWIGINQTAVNRYVEAALLEGLLSKIPGCSKIDSLVREPRLGSSRLDFLLNGDTYIEVKMPLKHLQLTLPADRVKGKPGYTFTDRLVRQTGDITTALMGGKKALMFLAFQYDNPGFRVPSTAATSQVRTVTGEVLAGARSAGLEQWQINFSITPEGITVEKILPLVV